MAGAFTIQYVADVEEAQAKRLLEAIHAGVRSGAGELRLLLSSVGGNTYWGMTIHNVLRGLPIPVTTFNIGHASSVAAAIYCAGTRRLCVPHAKFLLHRAMALPAGDGGPTSIERLEERLASARTDTQNLATILAATTGRSMQQVLDDLRSRTVLDAPAALEYGLVHEIREGLHARGDDIHLIL